MKKKLIIAALMFAAFLLSFLASTYLTDQGYEIGGYILNRFRADDTEVDKLKFQQTKGQVYLFEQALNEFGATSPKQAVSLWAKADQTRNGVLKYALCCDNLRKVFIEKRGKAEDSFWIIGGSSPHLRDYEIIESKKINAKSYLYKIKYYWAYSGGELPAEIFTMTVNNTNGRWCVQEISNIENIYTFNSN